MTGISRRPLSFSAVIGTFGTSAGLSGSTAYVAPYDSTGHSATEADHQWRTPKAMTVSRLDYSQNQAVAAGKTLVIQIRDDGANVGTAITLIATETSGSATFATPITIAAGSLISFRLTGDGVGSIPAGSEFSVSFVYS